MSKANSIAATPSCAGRRRRDSPLTSGTSGHWVSITALRLIVPLVTKPKDGNSDETARLAVIVTNWPATPLAQAAPQM